MIIKRKFRPATKRASNRSSSIGRSPLTVPYSIQSSITVSILCSFLKRGAQIISNIDKVDMKGYEADFNYRPLRGWDIFGNVGYTDAIIKAYAALPASVDKTAPYVPKFSFNGGTQYALPVSSKLQLITRVDMHRKGSQYYETLNTAGARSAFNLFDARVSLGDTSDRWRLSAWTKERV